jgi:hypothetical protein
MAMLEVQSYEVAWSHPIPTLLVLTLLAAAMLTLATLALIAFLLTRRKKQPLPSDH